MKHKIKQAWLPLVLAWLAVLAIGSTGLVFSKYASLGTGTGTGSVAKFAPGYYSEFLNKNYNDNVVLFYDTASRPARRLFTVAVKNESEVAVKFTANVTNSLTSPAWGASNLLASTSLSYSDLNVYSSLNGTSTKVAHGAITANNVTLPQKTYMVYTGTATAMTSITHYNTNVNKGAAPNDADYGARSFGVVWTPPTTITNATARLSASLLYEQVD
ncbi:MAG: hypothetical protein LBQ80_04415 [Clostridium sp.]|nr:hypothetical protein [Clostridium sp.]